MSFNGSGTFVVNTSGQPVVPNTVISATAFNALTNDLANGLSTCITKDGQTTPTANIPMGNNKITGLAPGTSGTDAANLSQVQGSTAKLLQSVTGTDTITAAMVPALTAYAAGQMFYFVAAGDNTGAVTINIDSLGAKSVTRDGSVALVAGDILSGEIALVVYDGTRFQLLNGNSFTNLNVSNNLTLSASTANGVAYLNGSKVLTSGSALVFDGTNLGVGTASPSYKLDVRGGVITAGNGTIFGGISYSTRPEIGAISNHPVGFITNNTTQMLLDTSGNLGLGVTPSAWGSSYKGLQVTRGASLGSNDANSLVLGQNWYIGGADTYITSNFASAYQQINGQHRFYTAPSGTAGNAISFTQAMTLDASGNLLVGATSGSYHIIRKAVTNDAGNITVEFQSTGGSTSQIWYGVSAFSANAANAATKVGRDATTLRSINAGGTVNASGADYAEYMTKAGEFALAKGDVCGINADGKLTNVFANAISFVVKSTDPSYVGGDSWGAEFKDDPEGLEAARQKVDRIAFAGQVPVNVLGATPGQYIVPINDNGAIKGVAVSNPTFEQYQSAVGKVIAVQDDGRALIIVKVA